MREIKFRGWHVVQKRMFSAEEMACDQLTLLPTGSFINVSGDATRLSEIYPRDKFIPLQFTGLHDKNGKEIYEGDIVSKKKQGNHSKYQIIYAEKGINRGAFICQSIFDNNVRLPMTNASFYIEQLEVIGNIKEEDKLINKK